MESENINQKSFVDTVTDPDNPMAKIAVDGRVYQFSVKDFNPEKYDWLIEVLQDQMQTVHDRAIKKARHEFTRKAKELFGLVPE